MYSVFLLHLQTKDSFLFQNVRQPNRKLWERNSHREVITTFSALCNKSRELSFTWCRTTEDERKCSRIVGGTFLRASPRSPSTGYIPTVWRRRRRVNNILRNQVYEFLPLSPKPCHCRMRIVSGPTGNECRNHRKRDHFLSPHQKDSWRGTCPEARRSK
jgi:hypothetical protein